MLKDTNKQQNNQILLQKKAAPVMRQLHFQNLQTSTNF